MNDGESNNKKTVEEDLLNNREIEEGGGGEFTQNVESEIFDLDNPPPASAGIGRNDSEIAGDTTRT